MATCLINTCFTRFNESCKHGLSFLMYLYMCSNWLYIKKRTLQKEGNLKSVLIIQRNKIEYIPTPCMQQRPYLMVMPA